LNILFEHLQLAADGIKDTKTALILVPGCRGNSNQGRECGNFDAPIAIMFKAPGMDLIESLGVGMSCEAEATIMLPHKSKMCLEFFLS
jgi:hypothetical protein